MHSSNPSDDLHQPIAVRASRAAELLGVSADTFRRHIRPTLSVVRVSSIRLYLVDELRQWIEDTAEPPF